MAGLRLSDRRLPLLGFLFRHARILRIGTGAENCCTCDCYDEQFHRLGFSSPFNATRNREKTKLAIA
jgi:hypothetical protein